MSAPQAAPVRRRFFVSPTAMDHDPVVFAPREAHHIATVLRLRSGARIMVFDGRREAEADLVTVTAGGVAARLVSPPHTSGRPLELTLLQGIARGPKMDLIVRMGTELGLSSVFPVVTARSLPGPGAPRLDRWRRVAQEAARQSGRADLPEIHPPAALPDALAALGPVDLLVVPWEDERRSIGEVVAGRACAAAAVLIGPEGGLAAEEVELARAAGGQTVSLGTLILRTETAGMVAMAMLLYEHTLRPRR
jgi:16S rRNA (uracil1498-N3)-methyltransferase